MRVVWSLTVQGHKRSQGHKGCRPMVPSNPRSRECDKVISVGEITSVSNCIRKSMWWVLYVVWCRKKQEVNMLMFPASVSLCTGCR